MELRQLEYFVAVAEESSFTKAAARVHVTQSGVSSQIRRLERELGHPLLDRSGHQVKVTEVGRAVLEHARAALAAAAGAKQVVEEHASLVRGTLSVGMVTSSWLGFDLTGLMARFHHRHPAVEIALSEATSDILVEAVVAGRLDAAVIAPPATEPPPGLRMHVLADVPLVAAVPHGDPLSERAGITLDALRDLPLIVFPRSVGSRLTFDEACADAGFRPRVSIEASDPNVLAELAAGGLGVAVLPQPYVAARPGELRMLDVEGGRLRGLAAMAWSAVRPLSPATRAFVGRAAGPTGATSPA